MSFVHICNFIGRRSVSDFTREPLENERYFNYWECEKCGLGWLSNADPNGSDLGPINKDGTLSINYGASCEQEIMNRALK